MNAETREKSIVVVVVIVVRAEATRAWHFFDSVLGISAPLLRHMHTEKACHGKALRQFRFTATCAKRLPAVTTSHRVPPLRLFVLFYFNFLLTNDRRRRGPPRPIRCDYLLICSRRVS